ncbi:MAG: hypothetical protein O6940_00590 [Ignavibacteria bacterium]|nr:hypothetical protein [Ignavibacteria bacterium]
MGALNGAPVFMAVIDKDDIKVEEDYEYIKDLILCLLDNSNAG